MKYRIVESVEKKENINHPVDDNFTLSEELLNISTEKISESAESSETKLNESLSNNQKGLSESKEEGALFRNVWWESSSENDREDEITHNYYAVYYDDSDLCNCDDMYDTYNDVQGGCYVSEVNYRYDGILEDSTIFKDFSDFCNYIDKHIKEIDAIYRENYKPTEEYISESLEEDYEYSEYDKKLLVNRAKSIAKAISDLYNSNQVEAQGELPSVNEIAKALLDSPKKIDMYAKFLSKMKATKKAESLIEKLVKELMNFKKKLSMVKKPQPATESMNESVEELSDEEKKEIIDTLENMIESGETSCECWDEPTKFLVKSELRKKGLKFNVSGNDRGNKFSYHFEWWNPKTESMDESVNEDVFHEWKPNTSINHIKKVMSDVEKRGFKAVNNEREELKAAMDKVDKKGYTPGQRKMIRDWYEKYWKANRNKNKQESFKRVYGRSINESEVSDNKTK